MSTLTKHLLSKMQLKVLTLFLIRLINKEQSGHTLCKFRFQTKKAYELNVNQGIESINYIRVNVFCRQTLEIGGPDLGSQILHCDGIFGKLF